MQSEQENASPRPGCGDKQRLVNLLQLHVCEQANKQTSRQTPYSHARKYCTRAQSDNKQSSDET